MNDDTKLLAMLVHQGRIGADAARQALQSGSAGAWLARNGHCTAAEWEEWQRTEAGTRPVLRRYELGPLLGEGGMARVFRAIDRTDGRQVALKVLRPQFARDPAQVERFVREARLLIELDHPHIVKGYRVAREGDVLFFAMAEIQGRCLQDLLGELGRLEEESALQIVHEIAQALDALHARGLVHRDVKPGNILWAEDVGSVLIDLGFAVPRGAGGGDTTAGTVHYIAPEQARGTDELDVRADIYALGATLYHLVTGSLPFAGASSEEVLAKQVLESLSGEAIRELGLSPQLHYILEKMMAKDRDIRFQDPQQLEAEVAARLDQLRREREQQEAEAAAAKKREGRRPARGRLRRRR